MSTWSCRCSFNGNKVKIKLLGETDSEHRVPGGLTLIASVLMLAAFFFMYGIASNYETVWPFFAYALPFMVIAILISIFGIFTLKGENQEWGLAGLGLSCELSVLYGIGGSLKKSRPNTGYPAA